MESIKICSMLPGMMNAIIKARINRISVKDYSGAKGSGKVCSVILSDETGSVRLVLWNNEIEKIGDIREGDTIKVQGSVRQGMFGPEIMLGREGSLEMAAKSTSKTSIYDLKDGQKAGIRAALVRVFEASPFYETCPKCGATFKASQESEEYKCIAHGIVEPKYELRVTGIIDDGTESIRCVFFKEQAEQILGMNADKAKDVVLRKGLPELFKNINFSEYIFSGRVRHNQFFERKEFIIDKISEVDCIKEVQEMLA